MLQHKRGFVRALMMSSYATAMRFQCLNFQNVPQHYVLTQLQRPFCFQPAWGHIPDFDTFPMIAYRFSDLKQKVEADFG